MIRTVAAVGLAALVSGLLAACSPPAQEATASTASLDPESGPGAVAASAGAATPAASPVPQTRIFRDWMAVCDNANRCVALTGGNRDLPWLRIEMSAGPDARPIVDFRAMNFEDGQPRADARLSIDGSLVAADASAVPLLGQGRRAAVVVQGGEHALSLSGAAAALLWIDERQGRLDTPTALIRRGDRPAGDVPAAPARPIVRAMPVPSPEGRMERPLPAAMEALPAVVECRVDVPEALAETWPIGPTQYLWLVPCYRGAYNFGARLFIAPLDGSDARAVGLPTARGEPTRFVVNGGFYPATGTLESFNKGRGLGDCGTARTWAWTGRGFVLVRETAMDECWGLTADDWPLAYEAIVQ